MINERLHIRPFVYNQEMTDEELLKSMNRFCVCKERRFFPWL
jgi:hypothetical protein